MQDDRRNEEFFDFILSLGERQAFTPKRLSWLTEIPLSYAPGTGQFSVYRSHEDCEGQHPCIKALELRTLDESDGSACLIVIGLSGTLGITGADVYARLGEPRLGVPYPEQPLDDPLYYIYRCSWGELKFGISRTEPGLVKEVILQRPAEAEPRRSHPGSGDL